MSRRHRAEKRIVLPDPKYKDLTVSKFMSCLMYDGKRSIAETIVYGAFNKIEERTGQQPISVFHEALDNIKPCLLYTSPSPRDRTRSRMPSSA